MNGTVLVIDDKRAMCELVEAALTPLGVVVRWSTDPEQALASIQAKLPDVVLTDVRMPSLTGIELCTSIHQLAPSLPVIVMTGFGTLELAIEAIRAGAYDFLSKPIELDVLEFSVGRALEHAHLCSEVQKLNDELKRLKPRTGRLIGNSPAMLRLKEVIPKAAASQVPVLIEGETGTGKELLAQDLHESSSYASGPFIPVNCAALPEGLAETEFFGHVEGAYTDARSSRPGLFVRANGGTLFLDEIGELPLSLQPKLLRALQESKVRPVGSDREVPFQCRVIAATNRDLKQEAAEGRFRSDLYFRVAVIKIVMPPLRDRRGDILALAQHFNRKIAARMGFDHLELSTDAATCLIRYGWPGNVRELENAVERAIALGNGTVITSADLPEELRSPLVVEPIGESQHALITLAELERRHIERVLVAVGGNKKSAAEVLGLDRRTLYRKLERYER